MAKDALPPNVYLVRDRHGKPRYRYVRRGVKGGYLPGAPWSEEWLARYAELSAQARPSPQPVASPRPVLTRSMEALAAEMRKSLRWKRHTEATRKTVSAMMDRLMDKRGTSGKRFGDRLVKDITVAGLEAMLGRMADTPGAAHKMRGLLISLFNHAAKLGWRADNPATHTDPIPQVGEGFHTWTDDEIEQFRARHAYGTTARLVLELALNTTARRCNLATLEHAQIRNGRIMIEHAKGGHDTIIELEPEAKAAIEAMPSRHIRYLIVTAYGKPFTVAGLGMRFRAWADGAGLQGCTLHGLRKARTRQLAEAGATNAEGRAITGHRTDEMFNHYAAKANRSILAANAMAKLKGGKADE